MSTVQAIMRFEFLPNEMIIECFKYLNAVDIFPSFDQLNDHFNKLIRNIFLNLDVQIIPKLKLDQFCKKMFSNSQIKKQIYSLQLSNSRTVYRQIHMFLSTFSLDEFPNLRSLTLKGIDEETTSYQIRYYNKLMNNTNAFNNITDLVIYPDRITEKCQYSFPNVISLELGNPSPFADISWLDEKHIEFLKMIVNLSNIKGLKISLNYKLKSPSVLLEILKQAPQLSSLSIDKHDLILLFEDDELCKCLNKMIKNLCISDSVLHETNKFSEIFSNIEQLVCKIEQLDSLLFLLKTLPKLSYINASLPSAISDDELNSFKEEVHKLDEKIIIDIESYDCIDLSIYIIRD